MISAQLLNQCTVFIAHIDHHMCFQRLTNHLFRTCFLQGLENILANCHHAFHIRFDCISTLYIQCLCKASQMDTFCFGMEEVVDLLTGVHEDGCPQANQRIDRMPQHRLYLTTSRRILFLNIQDILCIIHVIGRQLVRHQIAQHIGDIRKTVFLICLHCFFIHFIQQDQNIFVQLWQLVDIHKVLFCEILFRIDIGKHEAERIAHLAVLLADLLQNLIRHTAVCLVIDTCRPQTQDIRTVFLRDFSRCYRIPL